VVAIHHHAEMITSHFKPGQWPGLEFVFTGQRGTGADLLDCLQHVPTEAFLVWNGDTVVDLDVDALLSVAADDPERGVIALTRREAVPNEAAFYMAGDGTVLASLEAVPTQSVPAAFAWRGSSTGVLLLRKPLLAPFSSTLPLSLEATVLPALVAERQLRGFDNKARYFLDFGTPAGLQQLNHDQLVFS
jgi:NDP-sugar pyrophosphorylase family protein